MRKSSETFIKIIAAESLFAGYTHCVYDNQSACSSQFQCKSKQIYAFTNESLRWADDVIVIHTQQLILLYYQAIAI
jgi:hypothetical protein